MRRRGRAVGRRRGRGRAADPAWPEAIAGPWDTPPGVQWMPGDDEVLVLHWSTPWVMGLDGSDADASYLGRYSATVAVDPDGPLVQRRLRSGTLVEWRDGAVVRSSGDGIAWGERMVAGYGMVALTGGLGGGACAGPIVIDTATGERVAHAPIRDRFSEYSDNGFLTAQGFLKRTRCCCSSGRSTSGQWRSARNGGTSRPGTSGRVRSSSSRAAARPCAASRSHWIWLRRPGDPCPEPRGSPVTDGRPGARSTTVRHWTTPPRQPFATGLPRRTEACP